MLETSASEFHWQCQTCGVTVRFYEAKTLVMLSGIGGFFLLLATLILLAGGSVSALVCMALAALPLSPVILQRLRDRRNAHPVFDADRPGGA